jgi:uncharacterized protein (TIGR01777 family)
MRVLLTGASGVVGAHLSRRLAASGHTVLPVSRRPSSQGFDWSEGSLRRGVESCDAIVHLAGENLFASRWNDRQKEELRASRIQTAARLARLAAEMKRQVLVSASAVGYYGASERQGIDEDAPQGEDFLARLCADWEVAAASAIGGGVRTVILRIGVVLAREGGALAKMLPPFRLGLGGPLGNGRQWVSWIHNDDLASLILFVLETRATGTFNATAPHPVRMAELARALGAVLRRPAVLPVPAIALKLMLGEAATVLLSGQHVLPRRALAAGFEFRFPHVSAALRDLLST